MRLPYKISEAGSRLYRAGVSYHNWQTVPFFQVFTCDPAPTPSQVEEIKGYCPDAQFKTIGPQYAPEIRRVAILFPRAAWYRDQRGRA